jgi:hypothetical protein
VVVGVERIDEVVAFEVRVERQSQQAPVAVVVDLRPQVGEDFRRGVVEVAVDEDLP